MERMTEEEAWALDDQLTKDDPELGVNGTGFVSQREARLMGFDTLTLNYLDARAEATHKTPAQVVGDLVRKELKAVI